MAMAVNETRRDPVCCYQPVMEYQSFAGDGVIKRTAGCHYDDESHSVVVDYEDYNLFQAVQECIPLSGRESMLTLLKQGKAKVEDFFDTGKNGLDTTKIPGTAAEALNIANSESEKLGALAKALGLKEGKEYTAEDLEDALTERVKAIWLAQQQSKDEGDKQ